jgi:UDP-glucuronate 4-epimerase
MALFIFTKAILAGRPIDVYNYGNMRRNFTYVSDVVKGVLLTLDAPKRYALYNLGNDKAELLLDFIAAIEHSLGKAAKKNLLPLQPGDVPETVADISRIRGLGFRPSTDISTGVAKFIEWYREYYSV